MIDLTTAANHVSSVVANVTDEQLTAPTPCPDYTVGDLLDHIAGLSLAFRWAADKDGPPDAAPAPGDASRLTPDWRASIPAALDALAGAWRSPDAWTGMTRAGGLDLPAEVAGLVALDELVLHGWDLAIATGQPFPIDEASVEGAAAFVAQFSGPGTEDQRTGLFGPELVPAEDASTLDRLLAMAGRDARWSPG
jgi:uncharacterized protein (TIGR03086 family)